MHFLGQGFYVRVHIYIYIYIHIHTHIYVYIYIYIMYVLLHLLEGPNNIRNQWLLSGNNAFKGVLKGLGLLKRSPILLATHPAHAPMINWSSVDWVPAMVSKVGAWRSTFHIRPMLRLVKHGGPRDHITIRISTKRGFWNPDRPATRI